MLTFAMQSALSTTLSPVPFKIVNLVLHILIFTLIYRVLVQLLRFGQRNLVDQSLANWAAVFGACLWLLSPLNLSTVAYVIQRMAQLSTLFVLAGLTYYLHVRPLLAKQAFDLPRFFPVVLWLLFFTTVAVLSKENGILLIPLVAAVEACIFRGLFRNEVNKQILYGAWILALTPFVYILGLILLRPEFVVNGYLARDFTVEERLLTQPLVIWHYAQNFLIPNLQFMSLLHDDIELVDTIAESRFWLPTAGWIFVAACTFRVRKQSPLMFLGLFLFFIGHSIESSVLALEIAYEHRNYLPSVGTCVFLTGLLCFLRNFVSAVLVGATMLILISVSASTLFLRSYNWGDPIRLYGRWTEHHPQSYRSYLGLGILYYDKFSDEKSGDSGSEASYVAQLERVRSVLLKAHEIDPLAAGALVQLAVLDLNHFTLSPTGLAWVKQLEAGVQYWKALSPEDVINLKKLVNFAKTDACQESCKWQVGELIETVARKFPSSALVAQFAYNMELILLDQEGTASSQARFVARGISANAYLLRIEKLIFDGKYGHALIQSKDWLAYDRRRTTVEVQREILKILDRVNAIQRQPAPEPRID
ncbi:MAG: hypothetical protein ABJ056_05250 [Halioglobus sp.]